MARQKQKWTSEEEEALSAGVEKHGQGRWKNILTDPQFASSLANRSNVDLKDKWRNLSGGDHGSSSRGNVKTLRIGVTTNPLLTYPEPSRSSVDKKRAPTYKVMIYEALSSIEDPNGTDVNTMVNFLEPKYELPHSFRRLLTSKIRKLVLKGELEKVDNRYKVKGVSSGAETSQQEDARTDNVDNRNEEQVGPVLMETPEDAASVAAYHISVAENMEQEAIKACEERDKLAKLLEESMAMLKLAEDLYERCSKEGMVLLPT